jgi:hypothetical protein
VWDLSIEGSDGPIGINPVEMTTPMPNWKAEPGRKDNEVNTMAITTSTIIHGPKILPNVLTPTTREVPVVSRKGW